MRIQFTTKIVSKDYEYYMWNLKMYITNIKINVLLSVKKSSRTPIPKLWIFSSRSPNPKFLTAKLEGTGKNPRPRIRPPFSY